MFIDDMYDKALIELYRIQAANRDETPPETCWDEISTQLDIEEIWDSISLELDNILPVNKSIKEASTGETIAIFSRVASLILSLFAIWFLMLSDNRKTSSTQSGLSSIINTIDLNEYPSRPEKTPAPEKTLSVKTIKETTSLSNIILNQKENFFESKDPSSKIRTPKNGEANTINVHLIPDPKIESPLTSIYPEEEASDSSDINSSNPLKPIAILTFSLIQQPVLLMPSPVIIIESDDHKETEDTSDKNLTLPDGQSQKLNKFSVGISLNEKNTWMISQETIDGFSRQKLNTTKATFLYDFGIILRYTLNERWSLEGNTFISSKSGQSYKQYQYGSYGSKAYELKYFSFELITRYGLNNSSRTKNFKSYPVAGGYFSHLSSAFKTMNNITYNVSGDYDPIDYGVIFGYELEITLFKHVAIVPGVHLKYGIPNIFVDLPGIPEYLHYTRNASLEFRLNLIFPLSKK
jgi:hypothetical protein